VAVFIFWRERPSDFDQQSNFVLVRRDGNTGNAVPCFRFRIGEAPSAKTAAGISAGISVSNIFLCFNFSPGNQVNKYGQSSAPGYQ
jgi:hypothetical protein